MAIARWCVDRAEAASVGTEMFSTAAELCVPLTAPMRTRGVLVIKPGSPSLRHVPEQRRVLDTFAALIAIARERLHFVTVAQVVRVWDDFQEILRWMAEQFGEEQARIYAKTLSAAQEELSTGLKLGGARARSDIAKGLFTLHVARHGRKGRHLVMFRIGHDQRGKVIEVLRLLHDAMDLPRHLPPMDETT